MVDSLPSVHDMTHSKTVTTTIALSDTTATTSPSNPSVIGRILNQPHLTNSCYNRMRRLTQTEDQSTKKAFNCISIREYPHQEEDPLRWSRIYVHTLGDLLLTDLISIYYTHTIKPHLPKHTLSFLNRWQANPEHATCPICSICSS